MGAKPASGFFRCRESWGESETPVADWIMQSVMVVFLGGPKENVRDELKRGLSPSDPPMTDEALKWLDLTAMTAIAAIVLAFPLWLKVLEFRRRFIRVQPSLRTSLDHDIPGPEAWLIAQIAPLLKELGFEIAANGHCPDIDFYFAWTQVLFLNRAVGDRASLIVKRNGASAWATIAFATEAPGESQVTTGLHYRLKGWAAPKPDNPPPDVKSLYAKHRQAVAERALSSDQRVLPEIGYEHQWLHERAAKIAKSAAEKQRMVQIGEFYRFSWRSCAWHVLKSMGQKFKLRRKARFETSSSRDLPLI